MFADAVTWHNLFRTVEGLVAVGTIALAFVTGGLAAATFIMARKTAKLAGSTDVEVRTLAEQVQLAREQVEVARLDVEVARASAQSPIRPVLVDLERPLTAQEADRDHRVGWSGTPEIRNVRATESVVWGDASGIYISVPLRNIGPGAAFIRGIGLRWQQPIPGGGLPTLAVVPSGEVTRIQCSIPIYEGSDAPTLDEFATNGSFSLEVAYTDVAGEQWTMTRADVNQEGSRWVTTQIHLFHKLGERNGSIDWGEAVASSAGSWSL